MDNKLAKTLVGTPYYMAPTIVKKYTNYLELDTGYTEKCDIWSLGIICYEMLVGQRLFDVKSIKELMQKIENGTYSFPLSLSQTAISFISSILKYDEKMRPSAEQLLKHDFLTKNVEIFSTINLNNSHGNVFNYELQMNFKNQNLNEVNNISYGNETSINSFSIDDPLFNQ